MAGRSPARFVAPLALVAFALALYVVVSNTTKDDAGSKGAQGTARPAGATPTPARKGSKRRRRTYTVKAGDTPSGIAQKTGVPLEQILALNPKLDPQTLSPGTKIKLRKKQ
jgi:LysM repeat protein